MYNLEEIFFIVKINLIIPIQNFESIHKFFYFIIVHIMNDKKIISIPKNQYWVKRKYIKCRLNKKIYLWTNILYIVGYYNFVKYLNWLYKMDKTNFYLMFYIVFSNFAYTANENYLGNNNVIWTMVHKCSDHFDKFHKFQMFSFSIHWK